jgi:hypothetical protein
MKKKIMAIALCTIIAVTAIAGSSLAWLQDTTETVVNTFTEGKVDIELFEHDYVPETNTLDTNTKVVANSDYKMIPGQVLPKDPTVVVKASSEACYVFIKVEEVNDVDTFLKYSIDTDVWTALTGVTGVYYREVAGISADGTDATYSVLKDDQVKVIDTVTKTNFTSLTDATLPTLSFTAYAVQKDTNVSTAAAAWSIATTGNLPTT